MKEYTILLNPRIVQCLEAYGVDIEKVAQRAMREALIRVTAAESSRQYVKFCRMGKDED